MLLTPLHVSLIAILFVELLLHLGLRGCTVIRGDGDVVLVSASFLALDVTLDLRQLQHVLVVELAV